MAAPTVDSVWPASVAGWVALFLAIGSAVAVVLSWGKNIQKFEDHSRRLDELETKADDIDLVRNVLIGPLGDNGLNSKVRRLEKDVEDIRYRNTRIDAVRQRELGAAIAGHEERRALRREEDKILRGESDQ